MSTGRFCNSYGPNCTGFSLPWLLIVPIVPPGNYICFSYITLSRNNPDWLVYSGLFILDRGSYVVLKIRISYITFCCIALFIYVPDVGGRLPL